MFTWALGCFYSHISTRTFRRALTASVDSRAETKSDCPFSTMRITNSGRVWRKVPESDARSVTIRFGTAASSGVGGGLLLLVPGGKDIRLTAVLKFVCRCMWRTYV